MENKNRQLYELLKYLDFNGKDLTEKYHIIVTEEEFNQNNFSHLKHSYRVYHSEGYCFDVSKIFDEENNIYNYNVYSEWEGFKKIKDSEHAICLIIKI